MVISVRVHIGTAIHQSYDRIVSSFVTRPHESGQRSLYVVRGSFSNNYVYEFLSVASRTYHVLVLQFGIMIDKI
jgi:hypothetical protein